MKTSIFPGTFTVYCAKLRFIFRKPLYSKDLIILPLCQRWKELLLHKISTIAIQELSSVTVAPFQVFRSPLYSIHRSVNCFRKTFTVYLLFLFIHCFFLYGCLKCFLIILIVIFITSCFLIFTLKRIQSFVSMYKISEVYYFFRYIFLQQFCN